MLKLLLSFFFASSILAAQSIGTLRQSGLSSPVKREFRAAWVASVVNLDWPKNRDTIPAVQIAELDTLLMKLKDIGFNAVIFQIRPECDALYRSPFEPWSYWLTGSQGTAPDPEWDPLQYAIEAAHKRGMELHAWFNPFRAERATGTYRQAGTHVVNTHPEWILTVNNTLRMLDPGIPDVRNYVANIIADVVRRYDIDGVHWDDYFYPYSPNSITTHDDSSYAAYNPGNLSRGDWRRGNVNALVKMVSDSVKAIKPWVKFGISPFGVWKRPSGTSAFEHLYNDAVYWMQQQYLDYLTPQLYWPIGSAQDYSALLSWWNMQANGRHIYPGQAAYRIQEADWDTSEVLNQIRLNRAALANPGAVFFRATLGILNNPKGFADSLKNDFFRYPSIVPAMPWLDSIPPLPPLNLTASIGSSAVTLQWQKPPKTIDNDSAQYFIIYRSQSPDTITISDVRQILAVTANDTTGFVDSAVVEGGTYSYAVTSMDKLNNESDNAAEIIVTVVRPAEQIAELAGFLFVTNYFEDIDTNITIHFILPATGHTSLKIYDLLENEVGTIVDGVLEAGPHSYRLFTQNLANGVYVSRIVSGSFVETKKIVVWK